MNKIIILFLRLYKFLVSPVLRIFFGEGCRYNPTCSEYAIEALERYGTIKGVGLGVQRVLKCHPLGGSGYDPVPDLR